MDSLPKFIGCSVGDAEYSFRALLSLEVWDWIENKEDYVEMIFYSGDMVPLEGEEREMF